MGWQRQGKLIRVTIEVKGPRVVIKGEVRFPGPLQGMLMACISASIFMACQPACNRLFWCNTVHCKSRTADAQH